MTMRKYRNPWPAPSPLSAALLRDLVAVAKACYDRGWSHGTAGNFSLRERADLVWQSPSGLNKGALDPFAFIPVDPEDGRVYWPEAVRPSQEMPVHLGIYRHVPTAVTVVHTHPPELVRASRGKKVLRFQGEEMQKHLGCPDHKVELRIPVITNPTPAEMPAMTELVGMHVAEGVPMVILETHGVYAWGRTPMEALSFIEAAEFLARTEN